MRVYAQLRVRVCVRVWCVCVITFQSMAAVGTMSVARPNVSAPGTALATRKLQMLRTLASPSKGGKRVSCDANVKQYTKSLCDVVTTLV